MNIPLNRHLQKHLNNSCLAFPTGPMEGGQTISVFDIQIKIDVVRHEHKHHCYMEKKVKFSLMPKMAIRCHIKSETSLAWTGTEKALPNSFSKKSNFSNK